MARTNGAPRGGAQAGQVQSLDRALGFIGKLSGPRPARVVIAVGAVATALSIAAIPSLSIGAHLLTYFKPDSTIRLDTAAVEKALGGTGS